MSSANKKINPDNITAENIPQDIAVEESSSIPKISDLPDKMGMDKLNEVKEGQVKYDDINVDQAFAEITEIVKPIGINFPEIDPVLFSVGAISVRWYSLAYLFGILLGWWYIGYVNKNRNNNYISQNQMDAIPLWIVLSIIIGGRLGYVLFYNFEYYSANLSEVAKVWQGGMSFHGGLLGVIIGMYGFAKLHGMKYLKLMDMLAIATPIGLFLGRIANFINMELWGRRTAWEYGILYPNENFARHPSQLYEAFFEGLVLFLILFFIVKLGGLKRKGLCSGLFLSLYAVFRFGAEFFREPDLQLGFLLGTNWLTMGMLLCIPMFALGLIVIYVGGRDKN